LAVGAAVNKEIITIIIIAVVLVVVVVVAVAVVVVVVLRVSCLLFFVISICVLPLLCFLYCGPFVCLRNTLLNKYSIVVVVVVVATALTSLQTLGC